ncbi:MAG: hypothetical protein ACD_55C00131G0001 [uncultured bacterium]|nr:MAG: hypothetical protein ACD_55C00131G0001 [uncultured bacterium]
MQRPSLVSELSLRIWMLRPRLLCPRPRCPKRLVMSGSCPSVSITSANALMLFSPATSPAASFMVSMGVSFSLLGSLVSTTPTEAA